MLNNISIRNADIWPEGLKISVKKSIFTGPLTTVECVPPITGDMWCIHHDTSKCTFTNFNIFAYYTMPCVQSIMQGNWKQGKSEGFESCDRPIVRKRPIWVKIGDILSRVTLKFDGWPWKTIGHLFFVVSSFVQHFIAIGEFKLELQSGNAQFESNSTIFRAMWPWNLMDDLEKQ